MGRQRQTREMQPLAKNSRSRQKLGGAGKGCPLEPSEGAWLC